MKKTEIGICLGIFVLLMFVLPQNIDASCLPDLNWPEGSCNDTLGDPNVYRCGTKEILDIDYSFNFYQTATHGPGILEACLDHENQVLKFILVSSIPSKGTMTIKIPREELNPLTSSCKDDMFQIERGRKHTVIEEIKTTDFREITFQITSNDSEIKIFAENPENTKLCSEKNYSIPDWVRNSHGWWADGISDSGLEEAITFLIKEEILTSNCDVCIIQKFPEWLKNNAGWWADGLISDEDYLNGIQYLLNNRIIVVR